MFALNTWVSRLEPERQSMIRKWSRFDKKLLHQILSGDGSLTPKEERLLYRIALIFFKSIHPKEGWREWIGENQAVERLFNQKQQTLEIQKEEMKRALCAKSRDVEFPLGEEEINQILCRYFKVIDYMERWSGYSLSELYEMGQEGLKRGLSPEKSLALASLVMKKTHFMTPYYTQLVAVLAVLSEKGETKGRLAQVKTGEGKTMIITLLAFTLVMQGKSVDIVSSSHYLATRDQKKNAPFFKNFGIITSHICEHEEEKVDFDAHILYGKATDFEFALMREKINQQTLFICKHRKQVFDCVIVDEVDNMLIDTALNSARISYPSLRVSKHSFYPLIYAYAEKEEAPSVLGFKSYASSKEVKEIPFSDLKLQELLVSASIAIQQKEGVDYVLHTIDDPFAGKKLVVKIIDHKNTGQIQEGMRWSHGIHEFLEVRHGIELDRETMTPISFSHVIYYDLYRNIFGFSGTLGSIFERNHIKTIYRIDLFDLPSYRPSLRKDLPIKKFDSLQQLRSQLIERVKHMQEKGRPVLILCLSIKETREVSALFLESEISHQLYNEMQEEDAEAVIQKGGESGVITLSTNNAGRGTDITLSEESLSNGGLHVIFTYYPASKRVEDQGIGRAGRQGQVGSSEVLVVSDCDFQDLSEKRLEQEKVHAEALTKRAALEREVRLYVDLFWDRIGEWKREIRSGHSIARIIQTFDERSRELALQATVGLKSRDPSMEFVVEELLLKVEQEVFQRWSETFIEPSEQLMRQLQSNLETAFFNESLKELYKLSRSSWEPLIGKEGCNLYLKETMLASYSS